MSKGAFDLEDRLIDFAVEVIGVTESLSDDYLGRHIRGQLVRSGTSPAPNYGEAQGAESRADFIHKMRVALKELRETKVWLKIIARKQLVAADQVTRVLCECDELVAIFVKSVETAKRNQE